MHTRICKKCGAENLLRAETCYNCGAGLGFAGFMKKVKIVLTLIGFAIVFLVSGGLELFR